MRRIGLAAVFLVLVAACSARTPTPEAGPALPREVSPPAPAPASVMTQAIEGAHAQLRAEAAVHLDFEFSDGSSVTSGYAEIDHGTESAYLHLVLPAVTIDSIVVGGHSWSSFAGAPFVLDSAPVDPAPIALDMLADRAARVQQTVPGPPTRLGQFGYESAHRIVTGADGLLAEWVGLHGPLQFDVWIADDGGALTTIEVSGGSGVERTSLVVDYMPLPAPLIIRPPQI